ncbi:YicC/YloC family endoribonuclease [Halalkalibacillus halophilus]|uniref:YicC/YloC family endoribonuclease n=1 Tax=Halalkalibacillus halophilus TaxID=392827 RepID=UPI00041879BE|nr:YicC/YloC family endoribonuclease [Halalkalibacillus halophilus]
MVNSMTGYGQSTNTYKETTVEVEVRTVNHRYLDYLFRIPRQLYAFEDEIKSCIKEFFYRGRIEIDIKLVGEAMHGEEVKVNWSLLNQYLEHVESIKANTTVTGDLNINQLITMEGIWITETEKSIDPHLKDLIVKTLRETLQRALKMRKDEGESLYTDVLNRLSFMYSYVKKLTDQQPQLKNLYHEKLSERVKELAGSDGVDENRLAQEVAHLVDKGDISEEIIRLESHLKQMENLLETESAIGRRLDFLTQELLRETNTIGSKSFHEQISEITVALKSEIEKVKEQVQNIE